MHPNTPYPYLYPARPMAPVTYVQPAPVYLQYRPAPHYPIAYPPPVAHHVYVPAPPPGFVPAPQPVVVLQNVQNYGMPPAMPIPQPQEAMKAPIIYSAGAPPVSYIPDRPPAPLPKLSPPPPPRPRFQTVQRYAVPAAKSSSPRTPGAINEDDICRALRRVSIDDHSQESMSAAKHRLARISTLPNTKRGPSMAIAKEVLNPDNVIFNSNDHPSDRDMAERWNRTEWYLGPRGLSTHYQGARPKKRVSRLSVDRASLRHRLLRHKCQVELNERSRRLDLPELCDARLVPVKDGVNRTFTRRGCTKFRPSKLRKEIKPMKPMKKRPEQRRGSLLNPAQQL